MRKPDLSLIIACYQEGPIFEENVLKIVSQLKKLKRGWEIVFVEDKSQDETKKTVEKLLSKIDNSRAIFHKSNQGRGKSVSDGIKAARGEVCGFLDVDLEVSERYIPLFIKEVENGSDLVVGQRFYEGGGLRSFTRYLASKIYSLSVKILFASPVDDTEAGYKFVRQKSILPVLLKIKDKHWFWDTEICIRASLSGLKVSQVPVLFHRREDKKSTVRLFPDTIAYIKNLVRFKRELARKG